MISSQPNGSTTNKSSNIRTTMNPKVAKAEQKKSTGAERLKTQKTSMPVAVVKTKKPPIG